MYDETAHILFDFVAGTAADGVRLEVAALRVVFAAHSATDGTDEVETNARCLAVLDPTHKASQRARSSLPEFPPRCFRA